MRLAWVMGRLTASRRVSNTPAGSWLICEALDAEALDDDPMRARPRRKPMAESLVVYDRLGAGEGDVIAVAESTEATNPFRPKKIVIDAYCAAILDTVSIDQ